VSHKFLDSSFLFSFTSLFSLFYLSLSFGPLSLNNKIINENKEGKNKKGKGEGEGEEKKKGRAPADGVKVKEVGGEGAVAPGGSPRPHKPIPRRRWRL